MSRYAKMTSLLKSFLSKRPGKRITNGISVTSVKCPRCSSRSFLVREVCEEIGETVVNNGIVSDTNESYEGSLVSVICECNSCEHAWTPRHKETNKKAIMIDDFSEYFSAQEVEELRGEL